MKELIKAIQDAGMFTEDGDRVLYESDVIDLINEAMEGKVLVPVYPTTEMIEAAARHCYAHEESYGIVEAQTRLDAINVYRSMLSTIRTSGE